MGKQQYLKRVSLPRRNLVVQLIPKIGEVTKVGMLNILNSKSISQNVGGEYGKTANGSYLILNVTVKKFRKEINYCYERSL